MSDKKTAYVRVRLADVDRTIEWREVVTASTLEFAIEIAQAMPDVESVLEASWVSGGVVT